MSILYIVLRFYYSIIYSGTILSGRKIYSYRSMGVPIKKFLMSQHTKRGSGVEIVLLNNNFAVFISTVCVIPPPWIFYEVAANLEVDAMRLIFLGVIIHNNPPICKIFLSIFRFIFMGQKNIVSVTSTLTPTPWDNLHLSLAKYLIQNGLCFGFLMICLYSMATYVSSSII